MVKQEEDEFQACLDFIARPCLSKTKKEKKTKTRRKLTQHIKGHL
jgi:hypothetical protein